MILREVLHAHIPALRPASTIQDAVDKLDIYQFSALVVTDEDMKPVGVLTEGDVCRSVQSHQGLMTIGRQPVSAFMTADPVCGGPDLEVSDALEMMLSRGLTVLPVVEHDRLLGLVLRVDLMQAMLMDLSEAEARP